MFPFDWDLLGFLEVNLFAFVQFGQLECELGAVLLDEPTFQ
jgi:hypothetical protein